MFYRKISVLLLACVTAIALFAAVSCGKPAGETISRQAQASESQVPSIPVPVSVSDTEMEIGVCTVHSVSATGGEKISWRSSDESVASVDENGSITGISPGECTVTAENEFGNTAECRLTVRKSAFITIDDGPLGFFESILKELKKQDTKATFFVVNTYKIDTVNKAHDEGHFIGIHTYSHNFGVCYRSEYSYFADLEKMKELLKEKTGESPNIIRFPGGSGNAVMESLGMRRMISGLDDLGYRAFDWTVSAGDAASEQQPPAVVAGRVISLCSKDVEIILMHDKGTTAGALSRIIPALKKRGYVFDTLDHYAEHCKRTITLYERSHGEDPIPCTEVTTQSPECGLEIGKEFRFSAKMMPKETTDYLRFESDDPSIASVTLEGIITGWKEGTTNIRAIASSGKQAVCKVTVAPSAADSGSVTD